MPNQKTVSLSSRRFSTADYLEEGFSARPEAREYMIHGEGREVDGLFIFQAVMPKRVGLSFACDVQHLGLTFDTVFDGEDNGRVMLEALVPTAAVDELVRIASKAHFRRLMPPGVGVREFALGRLQLALPVMTGESNGQPPGRTK